jgi:hypothetical protein
MIGLPRQTQPARRSVTVYYLAWRLRPSHPWHSEEFINRFDAHSRYLQLQSRGYEAYLEPRASSLMEAG